MMRNRFRPTRGLQKRKCPKCGVVVEFYAYSTWESHLALCKGK